MSLLDRFRSDDDNTVEEELDEPEVKVSGGEDVTLVLDSTFSYEYTEHEAVAHYTSGRDRTWVFDGMKKSPHGIVLWDYRDAKLSFVGFGKYQVPKVNYKPNGKEKFVTIPFSNLEDFETVERRDAAFSEYVYREKEVCRSFAETICDEMPDMFHIEEDDTF